ncbi:hypothetical protein ACFQNJ_02620 [Hydrogenophaga bisanensis]|uniref:Succinyltransferase-like protein n=1 Tax=Hydrogenophaga bisanensis TaxID=439611 RepID=A0ABW2R629_9BURK
MSNNIMPLTIGDHFTFAPGVHCKGNVIIKDHAYIGARAILKHKTPEKPLRIRKMVVIGIELLRNGLPPQKLL